MPNFCTALRAFFSARFCFFGPSSSTSSAAASPASFSTNSGMSSSDSEPGCSVAMAAMVEFKVRDSLDFCMVERKGPEVAQIEVHIFLVIFMANGRVDLSAINLPKNNNRHSRGL